MAGQYFKKVGTMWNAAKGKDVADAAVTDYNDMESVFVEVFLVPLSTALRNGFCKVVDSNALS